MSNEQSTQITQLMEELDQRGISLWLDGNDLRCGGDSANLTDNLVAQLRDHKAALVHELTHNQPLSFAQQRLWFLEQIPQESGVYHVPVAIKINGNLNIQALSSALSAVIERHEVLRTCFPAPQGEPKLHVLQTGALDLTPVNLSQSPSPQVDLQQQLTDLAALKFDLTQDAPIRAHLFQLGDAEFVLSLVIHHIACDGWSMDILIHELTQFYRAEILGSSTPLPALTQQYSHFARWQKNRLQPSLLEKQLTFWKSKLSQPPVLELPTDFPRPKIQQHDGAVVQFQLPANLVSALQEQSNQGSATLFMTMLAAFKVLLSRYSGQWDVVIGTPISNRQQSRFEGIIGLFINTLVLRTPINPNWRFTELLSNVRQTTLDAMAHQDLPFEQLIEALQPERDMSRSPIFQVKFRLENSNNGQLDLPGLSLNKLPQPLIKAKLDLSMDLYETENGIVGGLEYNTSLFRADTIERMADHYRTLLESIVSQPECPLHSLPILSEPQQQQQLQDWNNTKKPFNENTCFHYLVEQAATQHADATALTFDDGSQSTSLTYAELNQKANQLAHWLRSNRVEQEVIVGICMDRSLDMIIAMLAVMKAGGAYLPLDANYPQERLQYMLEDARVPVLLSHSTIELPCVPTRLNLDTDWPTESPTQNPTPIAGPHNLAYLIYTSGSTGLPKGVMIEHRGLVNLTEDKLRVCDVRAGDCVLNFFSFSFDASIPEIIMPLAVGGSLLLAPQMQLLPGPDLKNLMLRNRVSHITMTPSALVSLPEDEYPHLRMVLVGGEAPSAELIEKWSKNRVFINAYGPTETTVNASMVPCGNGHPVNPTLLPSANKQLYILDQHLQLLPVGAVGELHIGGVGLARGYLNRPELTAKQFLPSPFQNDRLYKTGDLACYQPDGRIRILGRVDHQLKIRGYRVEIGDVEHSISNHPQVEAAVVIAVDDVHQGKRLAAFAVATAPAEETPSGSAMRRHVGEQLPAYMVPSSFHWLEQLPLTPNGKIDNRALAQLADTAESGEDIIPPRNETEQTVAELYARILGNPNIGSDTDFFDAGGHSLLATQLVAQLLECFAVEINVMDLFEAPTVAGLAQRIEHKLKLARLQSPAAVSVEETEEIEL